MIMFLKVGVTWKYEKVKFTLVKIITLLIEIDKQIVHNAYVHPLMASFTVYLTTFAFQFFLMYTTI